MVFGHMRPLMNGLPRPLTVLLANIAIPHYGAFTVLFVHGSVASVAYYFITADKLPEHLIVPLTLFGCSFGLSLLVTSGALWLGEALNHHTRGTLSSQMPVSNVMFDGLAVAAVASSLDRAATLKHYWRLPAVLCMMIAIAVIFACASGYLGLAYSSHALSVQQVLRLLIAQSPTGAGWDIGPFFWAMHTTFMPICFLLSFSLAGAERRS